MRRVQEDGFADLAQRHHAGAHQGVGMVREVVHADDAAGGLVGDELDYAFGFAGAGMDATSVTSLLA